MGFLLNDQNVFVPDNSGCFGSFSGNPIVNIRIQSLASLSTQKARDTDSILLAKFRKC
jgi:hypothetical protein